MRLFLTILIGLSAASAHAQYGIGLTPTNQCPYGYQAASGAVNGRDEVANLNGRYNEARNQLDAVQQELESYDDKIEGARDRMSRVLPGTAIRSIEDHRTFKRGYYDYYDCPKYPGQTASASGAGATATLPKRGGSANPSGSANSTPVYPPDEFCYGGGGGKRPVNTWAEFVDDRGVVSEDICNYRIPNYDGTPNASDSRECREGLRDYYRYTAQREKLQKRRAQLDADCRALESKINRTEEEVAEGSYCPYCNSERRGYSQATLTDNIMPMAIMLGVAGFSMMQQQNRPQYGGVPYGGPRISATFTGGPGAYPGNPYPAITPGYMGVQNGVYGALPGGVGAGAFCPQPNYISNPNLFGNPYANQLTNPAMQNSLFNPGYGPGFAATLGNGVNNYNPYDPYNPFGGQGGNPFLNYQTGNPYVNINNPYGNQYGVQYGSQYGFGPPSTLPYLGQNPYFQSQYQFNSPYGQQYGGNPYINMYGGGQAAYGGGYNPYMSAGMGMGMGIGTGMPYVGAYGGANPYMNMYGGGNPYVNMYGGGGSPYMNMYGSPYAQGVPYGGMYGNAGYSNFYMGGALGNFSWQLQQMRGSLGAIQNSPYYGGSMPALLPYPSPIYGGGGYPRGYGYGSGFGSGFGGGFNYSSPIYNIPGTHLNPLPVPPPKPLPQPLPVPPTPGGVTPGGIIRSR